MSNTIKYAQPNSYISTINTKMAEISRKMSGNITFVDQNKVDDIMDKVADLKASMNTLKSKITNNEDIADSYFENVLNHLEDCYQLIMTNVIEVRSDSSGSGETVCQLDTSEIEYLKALVQAIPAFPFPEGFATDWSTVKSNSAKVKNVPDALPNTLSNANWTSTYNAVSSLPSGLATDWSTVKSNSAKVAAVPDALPNTLSSTNWTSTYNAVSSIPSGLATDWSTVKSNSAKVAAVPDALPNTLSSSNWTSTYNAAAKIPTAFTTSDLATIKTNSAKVAAVPDALPNTLSSANWTSTYNAVSGIPTGFAVDWNKISLITKSDLTTALGNCVSNLEGMEGILEGIVLE
jgi:archaellum component FlaC